MPAGRLVSSQAGELPATYMASRPFLEAHVRDRVRALPTVAIRDDHDVVALTWAGERVTGVRVQCRDGASAEQALAADLVVDCLGRGARTPVWLAEVGFPQPAEEEVPVNVRYTSTRLRLRPGAVPEMLFFVGATPDHPSTVALFTYEHNTWQFSLSGYGGHHAKPDLAAMIEYAAPRVPPHVLTALREAEQLTEIATFNYPASRRRRYDRLRRFPTGLLVLGDAMCSFNPVYGQGMSVTALEVAELRRCLRTGEKNLARRFFRAAARHIDVAWQLAAGGDLSLPQVDAVAPLPMRLINAYIARLLATTERDSVVATQFLRVNKLLDPPTSLMRPAVMARVIAGGRASEPRTAEPLPSAAQS
jgi:2-polyprenyl-6-methoxyphenol hydroxylase-like FAD-dependent oxidoreductase